MINGAIFVLVALCIVSFGFTARLISEDRWFDSIAMTLVTLGLLVLLAKQLPVWFP